MFMALSLHAKNTPPGIFKSKIKARFWLWILAFVPCTTCGFSETETLSPTIQALDNEKTNQKAAEALARNSDFHFEIVTGLTSNFSDK